MSAALEQREDVGGADYNPMLLAPLSRFLREVHGEATLARIAGAAGIPVAAFDGKNHWISTQAFETMLSEARTLTGSDEAFKAAISYRLVESYGPLRMVLLAATPEIVLKQACKTSHMVCRTADTMVVSSERTRLHMRITPVGDATFSRLTCIARQATIAALPTLWGLPTARVREEACVARGDKSCELHFSWFDQRRWLPVIAGGIVGGAFFGLLQHYLHIVEPGLVFGAITGTCLGYFYEMRRAERVNAKMGQEILDAFQALAADEVSARRELVELTERQRAWSQIMEQQLADRSGALEKVVRGIDGLQRARVTTLRGFSHDLRNPLFVLKGNTQFLQGSSRSSQDAEVLADMDAAISQIEQMLQRLLDVATQETGHLRLTPKTISVGELADNLRRRLRALVFGREIKVSVFSTREAPERIEIDSTVLDRIADNLLTNAAKYTRSGSIVLELTGTPGAAISTELADVDFLTLKLSDTGQGMDQEQVEKIFHPRPASEGRTAESWGIGLSSTVRLLAQIGGRLDVMSKAELGTTFWAHLPTRPVADTTLQGDDNFESIVTNVVKIRRAEGS